MSEHDDQHAVYGTEQRGAWPAHDGPPPIVAGDPDRQKVWDYVTRDSGERAQLSGGMVRDTEAGKPRYDLIPLLPLRRLAELYARGAEKYEARNWEKANDVDALDRFKSSAFRHLMQALEGDRTEDHWSAVVFNVFGAIWLEDKLESQAAPW